MKPLEPPVVDAAAAGDISQLQQFLAADPEIVTGRNPGGETLLHIVSRQWPKLETGAEIAQLLLNGGADVNAQDQDGLRPLQGATGDLALTRVLLDAGAETAVYATSHMHMSPAEVCLYYGLPEEAALMVEFGAPVDLRIAAGLGLVDSMQESLDDQGNIREPWIGLPGQTGPNLSVADGVTQALSYAARNAQLDSIQWLLDHGADINALVPDFDVACTPLHQAVSGDHLEVIKLLLARGANRDILDDTHQSTPCGWAKYQGKEHLVELLQQDKA